jgi:hypothetical protein
MPREHENQANLHDHQTNYYIKKIISATGFDPSHIRSLGSEADIPPYSPDIRFTQTSSNTVVMSAMCD